MSKLSKMYRNTPLHLSLCQRNVSFNRQEALAKVKRSLRDYKSSDRAKGDTVPGPQNSVAVTLAFLVSL